MWEVSLQDLKGSLVINLKENNDVYVNEDMPQRTREERELHERLGSIKRCSKGSVGSQHISEHSGDITGSRLRRTLVGTLRALRGGQDDCKRTSMWGPDAMAVGDMVCLDLIQSDALSLGWNLQLLIGRDVYSGYGFAFSFKNKQRTLP
jgi:hypothetical protein